MLKRSHIIRRLCATFAAMSFALLGFAINASAAHADTNCFAQSDQLPSGHCYAIRTYKNKDMIGAEATIRRDWISVNPSVAGTSPTTNEPSHVNSEFWFGLANDAYIEAGSMAINSTDIQHFWADTTAPTAGANQKLHYIGAIPIDNTTVDYWQILRSSATNSWDIKVNYWPQTPYAVGTSTVTGSWNGAFIDMGGEIASNSCGGSAVWAQPAHMNASVWTWDSVKQTKGLWPVPWSTDGTQTLGCASTLSSSSAGDVSWSVN